MFKSSSYNQFFRECAIAHKAILHNTAAEGNDGPSGECTFYIGIDKAINGVRKKIDASKLSLIALKYEAKGSDNGAFDYRGMYKGAFIICQAADMSSTAAIETAEDLTEETAWDIINLIIQRQVSAASGLHCSSPFGEVSLSDFQISNVGPFLENHYGWMVEFDFKITRAELISPDRLATQFPSL